MCLSLLCCSDLRSGNLRSYWMRSENLLAKILCSQSIDLIANGFRSAVDKPRRWPPKRSRMATAGGWDLAFQWK